MHSSDMIRATVFLHMGCFSMASIKDPGDTRLRSKIGFGDQRWTKFGNDDAALHESAICTYDVHQIGLDVTF